MQFDKIICVMHMYAICWCSLCVQLGCDTIDMFTVCLHGWLQEKNVRGNAKFRLTPLTRAQMHTNLIATSFCITLNFWNGCACDELKVITAP